MKRKAQLELARRVLLESVTGEAFKCSGDEWAGSGVVLSKSGYNKLLELLDSKTRGTILCDPCPVCGESPVVGDGTKLMRAEEAP